MRVLVLFDFDGTLSRKDSFIPFLHFVTGTSGMIFRLILLLPSIALYLTNFRDNHWLKNRFITVFLKGLTVSELQELGQLFYDAKLKKQLRKKAIEALELHRKAAHECVVVSASAEYWLQPFCDQFGLKLICTRWETNDGRISGKILGKNNYGAEKARRILEEYRLTDYQLVVAYGDSHGDSEMLELAGRKHYRNFVVTTQDGI